MKKRGLNNISLTAPLWKRTFAYLVDLFVINLIVVLPFKSFLDRQIPLEKIPFDELATFFYNSPAIFYNIFLTGLAIMILSILYWFLLEYFLGQSIGKMLFGINVISLEGTLRFSQALLRNLTKFSTPILLIDSLYMLKGRGMRFFEKLSRTKVVER